ncbi:hypothetical protein [Sediminibacillus massiliensis]|uniref:hypothetical protein n=1 Tax=Sediminibacillus massiliensis TaxID=1926277 RepID=UPI0009887743|nr:hypothetical protein [Sediminibacillus massiliensis]
MDSNELKKAINKQISEEPLFTEADRRKFHQNKPKQKPLPVLPKIMTVLLAFLMIGGSVYFYQSGNPFLHPASDEKDDEKEEAPNEEKTESKDINAKIAEIKKIVLDYPKADEVISLIEQHGGQKMKHEKEQSDSNLTSFVYSDETIDFDTTEYHSPPAFEKFKKENIDLFVTLEIEEPILKSVKLIHLSEDKEHLIEERFDFDAFSFGEKFKKIDNPQEPVKMDELFLRSIAMSIGKEPEEVTNSDLLALEELTINASHLDGTYQVDEKEEYFEAMQSLRVLKLNQAIIPGELLKHLPILEQVTFIGPTVDDLSSVSEGMQHVQYLNIQNSSFNGTVEDILQLESLTIVNLDPTVVPDYEELQFEGIDVRW